MIYHKKLFMKMGRRVLERLNGIKKSQHPAQDVAILTPIISSLREEYRVI